MDILRDAAWDGIGGILTVLTILIGFILFLAPSTKERFREFLLGNMKWVLIAIVVILVFVFGFESGKRQSATTQTAVPENFDLNQLPLHVINSFDFENAISPTNTGSWKPIFGLEPDTLIVNTNPDFAHTGNNSLQLQAQLNNFYDDDWSGVSSIVQLDSPSLLVAWVYIPLNDQTMNEVLLGHIYIGGDMKFSYGNRTEIRPGDWTPIMVNVTRKILDRNGEDEVTIEYAAISTLLEIQIWHYNDSIYSGPIYIDDVYVFASDK